jgi:hypothetical protein
VKLWYLTVSVEGIFYGTSKVGTQGNHEFAFGARSPRWIAFTTNSDTPYGWGKDTRPEKGLRQ